MDSQAKGKLQKAKEKERKKEGKGQKKNLKNCLKFFQATNGEIRMSDVYTRKFSINALKKHNFED